MKEKIIKFVLAVPCILLTATILLKNYPVSTLANKEVYIGYMGIYSLACIMLLRGMEFSQYIKSLRKITKSVDFKNSIQTIYSCSKIYFRGGSSDLKEHIKSMKSSYIKELMLSLSVQNSTSIEIKEFISSTKRKNEEEKEIVLNSINSQITYAAASAALNIVIFSGNSLHTVLMLTILPAFTILACLEYFRKRASVYYREYEIYLDLAAEGCTSIYVRENPAQVVHKLLAMAPYEIDFKLGRRQVDSVKIKKRANRMQNENTI